ncbi:hypothetical protein [Fluviicola sp.]|uniref:hypothetical protein n=1 Tax=Fluviicola sp. TaxID=1917219 RepID=UPI0031DC969F
MSIGIAELEVAHETNTAYSGSLDEKKNVSHENTMHWKREKGERNSTSSHYQKKSVLENGGTEELGLMSYVATVRHDSGTVRLTGVTMSGHRGAVLQVMAIEGCPECAIIGIELKEMEI